MRLDLHVDGEEQTIVNFTILISPLLDLAEKRGLIKHRLITRADDDIIARDETPPEIIRDRRGRVKSLTPEIESFVCRLHVNQGMDHYNIARELRIGTHTAYKILGKHGFNRKYQDPMTDDQIQEAISLYSEENLSATKVAKRMGRALSTICKHLQAAKVMTRITPAQVASKNVERSNVRRIFLETKGA